MMEHDEVVDYFKEHETLPRDIFERELKVPLNSNFIISIIGPRRAGKTYYFFHIFQKSGNALYLNFEDSRLADVTYKEIRDIIRIFIEIYGYVPKYLLLDEIQNINRWEIITRELYDMRKYRIFITGSSSRLLGKEIATQLRGRSLSYVLLPFSFREFLGFKKVGRENFSSKDKEAVLKNMLREYLEFGGFPDVVKNEQKLKILREYSDLILFKDFVERHDIRNLDLARALHTFVLQNFSKEISIRGLFNKLRVNVKVGKDMIYEYVTKLEDTIVFFFLKKFSRKAHLREVWPKKIYLCDTGLSKVVRYHEDYGKLMENAVFLDLVRKKNTNPLLEIFYLKFTEGHEVDFVLKEGSRISQLIQVSYASGPDEIEKRELRSLLKASKELNCRNLLVVTWDYEGEEIRDNRKIKFVPLWKWLLF